MSELDQFFAARDWGAICSATGWSLERPKDDAELVYLSLTARDDERYRVLFQCDHYPKLAPSVAFVDAEGSKLAPKAWPHGDDEFFQEIKPPPNAFLCMPLTREGLAHHGEWASAGVAIWNPLTHTLADLFNRMHRLVNGPHYLRRGGA
jgi:hypothetical protein